MKVGEQAVNAIKWIDELPSYKQSPEGRKLGDEENGYCCIGAACVITGTPYSPKNATSNSIVGVVGLKDDIGYFGLHEFYGNTALTTVNDYSKAGFKRIATLLKTHPDWMFEPKVAELITKHYAK